MCVCMCMRIYIYMCEYLRRPEESVGSPGAEVIDHCKLPGVGAGN